MRLFVTLFAIVFVAASSRPAQPVPAELSALAAKARLASPLVDWCRGEFQPGHPGTFAVAVSGAGAGGRYLVLEADGTVVDLASFSRSPDLSCYTSAEARAVHQAIGRSDTIHGQVVPRWGTTVVCAFVDDTTAVCWQYSPADRAFVQVGGWVT